MAKSTKVTKEKLERLQELIKEYSKIQKKYSKIEALKKSMSADLKILMQSLKMNEYEFDNYRAKILHTDRVLFDVETFKTARPKIYESYTYKSSTDRVDVRTLEEKK